MAGYKETPRQKMIGMMYLVLTALLALNVSKDIIEAFVVVNNSLVVTNQNFEKKINLNYEKFKQQYNLNPSKVYEWYNKSQSAKKYSTEIIDYINLIKAEVISKVEGKTLDEAKKMTLEDCESKEQFDIPTQFFIGDSNDGSAGEARKLKNKINEYKKRMIGLLVVKDSSGKVIADLRKNIVRDRVIEGGKKVTDTLGLYTGNFYNKIEGSEPWEMLNFNKLILAGVITNLNRMQTEIRNAEFDVVNNLYQGISAEDFKFDKIAAKVVPKSSYVLIGGDYEAEIFVAAYDTKQSPEVTVWEGLDTITDVPTSEGTKVPGVNGEGLYKVPASGIGEKKFAGIIKIIAPSGEPKIYKFSSSYEVGQPSATVSADKMNVFYIGVDNPVTISVPGVSNDQVHASITNGTITSTGGGKYKVIVTPGPPNTIINVSATVNGRQQTMGTAPFRIKKVPNPVAKIANVTGGPISKAVLAASTTIVPVMDNFDFELYFKVTSFTFEMNINGDYVDESGIGNQLNQKMISMISKAKVGSKVWIENIKAYGAGDTRNLLPINLKLTN